MYLIYKYSTSKHPACQTVMKATYGHIVGGIDTDGGDVGAGAGPNVRYPLLHHHTKKGEVNLK